MDHQAVTDFVAQTRTDTLISTATYGSAAVTAGGAALSWISQNQSGLTVIALITTAFATLFSALYGAYHKSQIRKIAAAQGFDALRKSERFSED